MGVCIDRSIEMVVAIHAVVAAGGQYVPIATDAPADRVRSMVVAAGVRIVLTAADFLIPEERSGELARPIASRRVRWTSAWGEQVRTIVVDCTTEVDLATAPVSDAERLASLSLDNALYTLFTSGSTGVPKGVTVSHRAVLNRLWWGLDVFPWSVGTGLCRRRRTRSMSVPELFAPLFAGAELVIARPGGHADPAYIADLIAETAATSVHFVPSMLSVFVDVVDRDRLAQLISLKWVFASGEALPAAVVARCMRCGRA